MYIGSAFLVVSVPATIFPVEDEVRKIVKFDIYYAQ